MSSRRRLTVYIGRFSIWHNGHAEVALNALRKSQKVLIIVGSARQPRTIKNPWKAYERVDMIHKWYDEEFKRDNTLGELIIETNRDFMYSNARWLVETQKLIAIHTPHGSVGPVWITGAKRDDTSFYLDMFPSPTYELDLLEENHRVSKFLSATWCREIYLGRMFNGSKIGTREYDMLMRSFIPSTTLDYLDAFEKTSTYAGLVKEYEVIKNRQADATGKYGLRIDVTVDSVVIQSGHVLLIKRRAYPGKGLWALPGGYLEQREVTFEGALRELNEETAIKVPPAVLRSSMQLSDWYQHPDRSNINRVITHAFCFVLPDHKIDGRVTLPKVTGKDDAEKARWFPISEALEMSEVMFDDHHAIIEDMINRVREDKRGSSV